jgi:hypothetical protein
MIDHERAQQLTRGAALRLAAAGAAALALGVRPVRAAPTAGERVEAAARAFLKSLSAAARARSRSPARPRLDGSHVRRRGRGGGSG